MTPAASLYAGRVTHLRHTPFRRRFAYRIWMLCLDLARIDEISAGSGLFAHNRFALTALYDRDHGFRDGRTLRAYVEAALDRENLGQFAAKILLLATPRVFGYGFNPISFYFCYDASGNLGAVLHQVKNTFGDQIGYLMPVLQTSPLIRHSLIRQSADKAMHVSPFFDCQGGYRFTLTEPGEKFSVCIRYGAEVERLTATMLLQHRPFTNRELLRLLLLMPLIPMQVIAAIHWQAVKLFFRGAKFHAMPKQPHAPIIRGKAE